MTAKLIYNTTIMCTSLEVSKNKRTVSVFSTNPLMGGIGTDKIAEWGIEYVWDMLTDALSSVDVEFENNPGLWRRKCEALAALKFTYNQIMKENTDAKR